ncbi:MAG: FAD-binding oxidoreductase, partial [archaeon]|nr:FAD-binding oxidoreductase [archaeon]
IVRAGTRTTEDASGYQLARLLCSSEGTLGIITEITFKITTKPKKSASCLVAFNSVVDAGECIAAIIAKPLIPASCELMDKVSINAVNKARGNPLPDVEALIIVEVDGETDEIIQRDLKIVEEVAKTQKSVSVTPSFDSKEIAKWTDARKSVLASLSVLKPGYVSVSLADDMGVPVSQVPKAVEFFQQTAEKYNVTIATYGHASDGNLHTKMVLDPTRADEWERGFKAVDEIFAKCVELGGTVTGEHGVGISKALNFQQERESELECIRAIKKAFDPKNILNPGKADQWRGSPLRDLRYPCKEYM